MFSVPQFIDVEDKVAGPLTWKQLGWMIGMGAAVLVILSVFDKTPAIIISIPVVLFFMALAFYKPGGFPLTTFLFNSVLFLFRPKIAVWERPTVRASRIKEEPVTISVGHEENKQLTREKLRELAALIDSQNGR